MLARSLWPAKADAGDITDLFRYEARLPDTPRVQHDDRNGSGSAVRTEESGRTGA